MAIYYQLFHYLKNMHKMFVPFFSGHYQKYGVNIQACCDTSCRFTFVGIGGPGVTNDRSGIKVSVLDVKVKKIPGDYVVCYMFL
jgi:hypothetical protein